MQNAPNAPEVLAGPGWRAVALTFLRVKATRAETAATRLFRAELARILREHGVPLASTSDAVGHTVARQTYSRWLLEFDRRGTLPHSSNLEAVLKRNEIPQEECIYLEQLRERAWDSVRTQAGEPRPFSDHLHYLQLVVDPTDTVTLLTLKYRAFLDSSLAERLALEALMSSHIRTGWRDGDDLVVAEKLARRILNEFERTPGQVGELLQAVATIRLATIAHARWELRRGDKLFERAIALAPDTDEGRVIQAQALVSQSPLHVDLGDTKKAIELTRQAEKLLRHGIPLWLFGLSLNNRSFAELVQGDLDEAAIDVDVARNATFVGLPREHAWHGFRLLQDARIALKAGYDEQAASLLEKARQHMITTLGAQNIEVANVDLTLVGVIERLAGRAAALTRAEETLKQLERGYPAGSGHTKLKEIRRTVARLRSGKDS